MLSTMKLNIQLWWWCMKFSSLKCNDVSISSLLSENDNPYGYLHIITLIFNNKITLDSTDRWKRDFFKCISMRRLPLHIIINNDARLIKYKWFNEQLTDILSLLSKLPTTINWMVMTYGDKVNKYWLLSERYISGS